MGWWVGGLVGWWVGWVDWLGWLVGLVGLVGLVWFVGSLVGCITASSSDSLDLDLGLPNGCLLALICRVWFNYGGL